HDLAGSRKVAGALLELRSGKNQERRHLHGVRLRCGPPLRGFPNRSNLRCKFQCSKLEFRIPNPEEIQNPRPELEPGESPRLAFGIRHYSPSVAPKIAGRGNAAGLQT